jgi:hypothetical protein
MVSSPWLTVIACSHSSSWSLKGVNVVGTRHPDIRPLHDASHSLLHSQCLVTPLVLQDNARSSCSLFPVSYNEPFGELLHVHIHLI